MGGKRELAYREEYDDEEYDDSEEELPESVQQLPEPRKRIWKAAFADSFNSHGDEERAFGEAWKATGKQSDAPNTQPLSGQQAPMRQQAPRERMAFERMEPMEKPAKRSMLSRLNPFRGGRRF